MADENVVTISGANWQTEVMQSEVTVLADFWAEWCGPCKAIAPFIAEIAKEHAGKLKVVKVNVDDNGPLAIKYAIRSIPTLIILKKGVIQEQIVGAMGKASLKAKIAPHLQA